MSDGYFSVFEGSGRWAWRPGSGSERGVFDSKTSHKCLTQGAADVKRALPLVPPQAKGFTTASSTMAMTMSAGTSFMMRQNFSLRTRSPFANFFCAPA